MILFLSGAPLPKKNPVSAPVLCLLAVWEKPNSANLNKFAACGVCMSRATFNTTPYYPLLCMYFFIFYCFIFYIVSVQFGEKCNAPWREGRNLIIWAIKPLSEGGGGGSTQQRLFYFTFLCREAPPQGPTP